MQFNTFNNAHIYFRYDMILYIYLYIIHHYQPQLSLFKLLTRFVAIQASH